MTQGGFDVVIGNPPYVEYSKVQDDYTSAEGLSTEPGHCRKSVERGFATMPNQMQSTSMRLTKAIV